MKRGSFQEMKALNKSIILMKILNDGPISRAQIAKETKLTPPTVGTLVRELIEKKMVLESSQGESKGGRKPTMLIINQKAYYIIGLDAGPTKIDAILTDLSGKVISNIEYKLSLPLTEDEFLTSLIEATEAILEQSTEYIDDIIGIGVAMHGVVDAETGYSLYAPNLDLYNMPISDTLANHFSYIVKVENDARALALAENWFGQGKNSERLVVVNIGTGVGAGVTIDGELYRGESYIAGEIGHMTIDLKGEVCTCGNRGCLQTLISGPAISTRTKKMIDEGAVTSLSEVKDLTSLDVYQAAEAGDAFAREVLRETGSYIGIGLTNLIHTLNPSQIVLSGGVSKAGKYILPTIKATIDKRALTKTAKQTMVNITELGDHASALGAVALIIVELFAKNGEITI
ncbi:ROK family transcriptional regulator [Amphibacillus sp. MSJ-3]|uniref:ROK family transcriptional regulator n=1 Tax=Amphibacillus sp. MSJ-3 TaxID=2841505 RepID=UPI001C0EDB5B|nr:ROK family transcriptional regulator [Amphibacillus sp. MSJ-3]MBU5595711.1 ROK family transcriptional regulator [Amphibacillus sp. MSJ-3]